jgi:antitoxin PrlF
MVEMAQVSGRGTVTLPAEIRRKLSLREGDVLAVRISGSSIMLTPAVVTPVELYTDERIAEFERNAQAMPSELVDARQKWGSKSRLDQ